MPFDRMITEWYFNQNVFLKSRIFDENSYFLQAVSFSTNHNWSVRKGKCNFHSSTRDWRDSCQNLIPFVRMLLRANPRTIIQMPWKSTSEVSIQKTSCKKLHFRTDADTRWNKFFLRLNVHVCWFNPRDTFICLHCNYIWWQNYDPFESTRFEGRPS